MTARLWVNGIAGETVSALDRGLWYGDGLFETVLVLDGATPLWSRHMQRLSLGCERLGLPLPDMPGLHDEVRATSVGLSRAVVRVTLTRGIGERGYAPPATPRVTRIVSATPAPVTDGDWYASGIRVRFCETRLGEQPRLAGIKHLNRLEQVLARAEWRDAAIVEGLMRDGSGRVVCATAANLFAVIDGALVTPALDRCGVAGVARAEVLAKCPHAVVGDVWMEEVMRAEEVFLSSSVRGIVPVTTLGERVLDVGPRTRALQAHWRVLGLMPEPAA